MGRHFSRQLVEARLPFMALGRHGKEPDRSPTLALERTCSRARERKISGAFTARPESAPLRPACLRPPAHCRCGRPSRCRRLRDRAPQPATSNSVGVGRDLSSLGPGVTPPSYAFASASSVREVVPSDIASLARVAFPAPTAISVGPIHSNERSEQVIVQDAKADRATSLPESACQPSGSHKSNRCTDGCAGTATFT